MNKKLLAATLPLLGGVVIVGAGFSAWAFNADKNINTSLSGSIEVTELLGGFSARVWGIYDPNEFNNNTAGFEIYELTSSTGADTFILELDQGTLYNTDNPSEGVAMKTLPIYANWGTENQIQANFTITRLVYEIYYDESTYTLESLASDGYRVDFTDIEFSWESQLLDDYIRVTFNNGVAISDVADINAAVAYADAINRNASSTGVVGLRASSEITQSSPTLVYQSGVINVAWDYWVIVDSTSISYWSMDAAGSPIETQSTEVIVPSSSNAKPQDENEYYSLSDAAASANKESAQGGEGGITIGFSATGTWEKASS